MLNYEKLPMHEQGMGCIYHLSPGVDTNPPWWVVMINSTHVGTVHWDGFAFIFHPRTEEFVSALSMKERLCILSFCTGKTAMAIAEKYEKDKF